MRQRVIELDPAARDPGMLLPANLQRSILRQRLPRFLDLALAREDLPRKDQRLRLRPALDEPAIDEQLVWTRFGHEPA
jgi:hypothetical protein